MEKFFIVNNQNYLDKRNKVFELKEQQSKFIKAIFEEKGIDGDTYILSGDGGVNCPFGERSKSDIRVRIENTENNVSKFGKELLKDPDGNNLLRFRKNAKTMKYIQQKCVDGQIIINVYRNRPGDYFKEFGLQGYSYREFEHGEKLYLSISSNWLNEDSCPDGFDQIKGSEFFAALEVVQSK